MTTPTSTRWEKDSDDVLDYEIDWTAWLDGDTIAGSTWIVADGITKDSDTHTDATTTIWLSGGTTGASYRLTNRITTAGGRTKDRSRYIFVRDE